MTISVFMQYVVVGIVAYLAYLFTKKSNIKLPIALTSSRKYSIRELFNYFLTNRDLQIRLFKTIVLIFAIRIISLTPLPWANTEKLFALFGGGEGSFLHDILRYNLSIGQFSYFALGLSPFLIACVTLQVLSVFNSRLRNILFGGDKTRTILRQYTYILTAIFAIIQSYATARLFLLVNSDSPLLFIMLILTVAVFILIYFASLITQYGIGNGVAVIVLSDIVIKLVLGSYKNFGSNGASLLAIVAAIAIFIALFYCVFRFTETDSIIGVKSNINDREYLLPIRFSWVARQPLGWARFIYLLPATISVYFINPNLQNMSSFMMGNLLLQNIVEAILIVFIFYLYMIIVFDPKVVGRLLQKYNLIVLDGNEKKADEHIDEQVSKVVLVAALSMVAIVIIPEILIYVLSIPRSIAYILGASGILMLAGVSSDLLKQIEFYLERSKMQGVEYSVAYIAADETEAKIKSEYLIAGGIPALVEPLRFTWGLPIHTIVDEYRIYVPEEKIETARQMCV